MNSVISAKKERSNRININIPEHFSRPIQNQLLHQSSLSHQNNRISINAPEKVAVREEQYVIANISDMKLHSSELVAASYTEALQNYNELIIQKPELKDKVQVLAEYELN